MELEELEESELYTCSNCKKKQKSTKKFWIRRLPNVSIPFFCHLNLASCCYFMMANIPVYILVILLTDLCTGSLLAPKKISLEHFLQG